MTTAAKKARQITWAAPKCKGKTFAIKGRFSTSRHLVDIPRLIQEEGGKVVEEVTTALDYLIVGAQGAKGAEQQARTLIQKNSATIQIMTEQEFFRHLTPSRDELIAMLTAGPAGIDRWNKLRIYVAPLPVDLSGADLRNAQMAEADLRYINLDGADLSGADLSKCGSIEAKNANFERACLRSSSIQAVGCRFDGACLQNTYLGIGPDCSFVNADLSQGQVFSWYRTIGLRANFTDAKMHGFQGDELAAPNALFRNADLTDASLHNCNLHGADFSGADLTRVNLSDSDLTGGRLVKARLAGTNLGNARLARADLTDTDLSDAHLDGADLAGAKLDKRQLKRADSSARGSVGPHIEKLDEILKQTPGGVMLSVVIDLPDGPVKLTASGHGGERASFFLWEGRKEWDERMSTDVNSFRELMFDRTRQWAHGKPRLESITIGARHGPLPAGEFKALVMAGWCEAFGMPVPTAEEIAQVEADRQARQAALREQLLQELRGGSEGVARWNARPYEERRQANPLPEVDLSGIDLTGANLLALDFEMATFDRATLVRCDLKSGKFKEASFRKANLKETQAVGARFHAAVFAGARLDGVCFRQCWLRKANFHGAVPTFPGQT